MSSNLKSSEIFFASLKIHNFRNIKDINIDLSPHKNIFIGQNGQGKTNCLEAISLITSLRSMQTLGLIDLIKHGEEQALITANTTGHSILDLEIALFLKSKKAFLNQKPILRAQKLCQYFLLISFIPAELNMLTGSPSLRRNALDQACINLNLEHYSNLKSYEKILHQRNFLLKAYPQDREQIELYSKLIIEKGSKIIYTRINTINILKQYFQESIGRILGNYHSSDILYESKQKINFNGCSDYDIIGSLFNIKKDIFNEELARRQTLFGPHLDDINFIFKNRQANKYCSRGESRALVLAFKMAHMMALKTLKNASPIIILDDIFSELDTNKKQNMFAVIEELNSQCFFSSTDLSQFGSLTNASIFALENGCVV